jgi:hypothetical protein
VHRQNRAGPVVMRSSMRAGLMVKVSGSVSANTGKALTMKITL